MCSGFSWTERTTDGRKKLRVVLFSLGSMSNTSPFSRTNLVGMSPPYRVTCSPNIALSKGLSGRTGRVMCRFWQVVVLVLKYRTRPSIWNANPMYAYGLDSSVPAQKYSGKLRSAVFTAPALGFPETARDGVCVADTVANTQASRSALCLKESLFIASPHAPGKLPRACTAATPTPTSRAQSASAGCWAASLAAQNKTQPTTDSCGIGPKVRLSRELSRLSPMTMICSLGT